MATTDPGLGSPRTAPEAIAAAALRLRTAHGERTAGAPVRALLAEDDIAGAYAVQDANTRHWSAAGRRIVGRKIGLTSAGVQKALGIDQPDFGILFSDMELPDGGEVAPGSLIQPRAEGELAFVIGSDLTQEAPSTAEVLRAVAFALPAIEIVDSRIAGWDIGILDTIADNASSGLYVLGGGPVSLEAIDLRLCGMVLEVNGEPASTGAGLACLGHPVNALRWLARTMVAVGRPLMAGDVVLSGALGPLVAVSPGDHLEVRISGAGAASVRFAA